MRLASAFPIALFAAALQGNAIAGVEILKEEPPKNSLPRDKVVYVDDGSCPAGEIKEVTGGSQENGIPRKVRCIKRPD